MKTKKIKKKPCKKKSAVDKPSPEKAVTALGAECYNPYFPYLELGKAGNRHI